MAIIKLLLSQWVTPSLLTQPIQFRFSSGHQFRWLAAFKRNTMWPTPSPRDFQQYPFTLIRGKFERTNTQGKALVTPITLQMYDCLLCGDFTISDISNEFQIWIVSLIHQRTVRCVCTGEHWLQHCGFQSSPILANRGIWWWFGQTEFMYNGAVAPVLWPHPIIVCQTQEAIWRFRSFCWAPVVGVPWHLFLFSLKSDIEVFTLTPLNWNGLPAVDKGKAIQVSDCLVSVGCNWLTSLSAASITAKKLLLGGVMALSLSAADNFWQHLIY